MGHVREQLFRHLHERCVATKTGSRAQECAKCRLRDRPLGRTLLELRSPKPNPALLHVHPQSVNSRTTQPPSVPPHTHTTHPCYHNIATLQLQFSRTASNHRALPATHLILRLQLDRCLAVSLGLGPALNCSLRLRWVFPGKVSIPAPTNKSLYRVTVK